MDIPHPLRRHINKALASEGRREQASGHLRLMESDPANFLDDLKQIRKCGDPWPCRRSACIFCGAGVKTTRTKTTNDRFEVGQPHSHNNPIRWARPNTFIREKGEWMAQPFLCLPGDEISPCRITWSLLDAEGDPVAAFRAFRQYLYTVLQNDFPMGIARGYGEIACVHSCARYSTLPQHLVGPKIWKSGFSDQPGYLLHSHLNLYHPGLNMAETGRRLGQAFPANDQVWVGKFHEVKFDDNGVQSGGIQGWGEYAGFECKPLHFSAPRSTDETDESYDEYQPHENDNASVAHTRMIMLKRFTRPMRNIKFRDDEDSIADAVRRSWFPVQSLFDPAETTEEIEEIPRDEPGHDRPEQGEVGLEPVDFSDFLNSRLLRCPSLACSTSTSHRWSCNRFFIVKRSGSRGRKNLLKSTARSGQLTGFCQRPEIDKPP